MLLSLAVRGYAADADSLYAKDLLSVGSQAPDFDLKTADGKHIRLSDYRGNYVVLDFWASWCPDCRKDIPAMKSLFERYKNRNIAFVGISFDTDKKTWTDCYWYKYQMTWTQVSELKKWKKETQIDQLYKINWIPTMYLLDDEGRVLLATVEVEKLAKALAEVPAPKPNPDVEPATYEGGEEALSAYLNSHKMRSFKLARYRAEGVLSVMFNVEMDGTVTGPRTVAVKDFKCTSKRLNRMSPEKRAQKEGECLDLMKRKAYKLVKRMDDWKAGTIQGRPLQTQQTVDVCFKRR